MQISMVGLGKMGLNLAENILDNGYKVAGFDINSDVREKASKKGIHTFDSIESLVEEMDQESIVWVMLPAGKITDDSVNKLSNLMHENDILIDGGNSAYKDSIRHNELLKKRGIIYFDVGTSGGTNGARNCGNFMIGGDNKKAFSKIEPIFEKISTKNGYLYTGKAGSGHYLKMIHNGIEYGMMEAIAESFDILEHSQFDYDNESVARVWSNGSVIRGWLMELAQSAFSKDSDLENIKGIMHSSGEGRWTVDEALELKVPTPVIATSLMMRYRSMEDDTFTGKVVAALRNEFGGHPIDKIE